MVTQTKLKESNVVIYLMHQHFAPESTFADYRHFLVLSKGHCTHKHSPLMKLDLTLSLSLTPFSLSLDVTGAVDLQRIRVSSC